MSKWSGKCDFCDAVENGWFDYKTQDLYVDGIGPLKITSWEDLIPYYTCLTSGSNSESTSLYKGSFIDSEEKQCLQWRIDEAKKIFNRYKRKEKRAPTLLEFYSSCSDWRTSDGDPYSIVDKYLWEPIYDAFLNKKLDRLDHIHIASYNRKRVDFILYAFRHHKANHPFIRHLVWEVMEFNDGCEWSYELPFYNLRSIWNENEKAAKKVL